MYNPLRALISKLEPGSGKRRNLWLYKPAHEFDMWPAAAATAATMKAPPGTSIPLRKAINVLCQGTEASVFGAFDDPSRTGGGRIK